MWHVPQFRLDIVASALTVPYIVHLPECLLYTSYREELILPAIDKEHRLRAGYTGNVGIVQPATKTRQTVGKTTILRPAIVESQLLVSGYHPADSHTDLYPVAQGGKHPRAIASHGETYATYSLSIHLWQRSEIFRAADVVISHIGAKVYAVHHHVASYHVVFLAFCTLHLTSLAPHGSIGREYYITILGNNRVGRQA